MRDMPAFLKICARICLRYAKICRSTGSKCQPLDMTTYEGNCLAIFFLEIFAEIFLFVLLDWNLGEIFRILMLGNLIKSICCLFCMNDAEEVHRFYGSFRPVVKAGECVWIINSFHSGFRTLWSWQQCKCEPNLMPAYLPSHQSVSSAKCKQSIKQNIKQNIKAKYFSAKYNKWAMQI